MSKACIPSSVQALFFFDICMQCLKASATKFNLPALCAKINDLQALQQYRRLPQMIKKRATQERDLLLSKVWPARVATERKKHVVHQAFAFVSMCLWSHTKTSSLFGSSSSSPRPQNEISLQSSPKLKITRSQLVVIAATASSPWPSSCWHCCPQSLQFLRKGWRQSNFEPKG